MPELSVIDEIFQKFLERGQNQYGGERVSQLEHALQAAVAAEESGYSEALMVAALLHDFGHLLDPRHEEGIPVESDHQHEELSYQYLSRYFVPEITEPIRLHVDAKRYLCCVDRTYRAKLSPASEYSLMLQGGPMTTEEAAEFQENPNWHAALALRTCDEIAKVPGQSTPDLEYYRPLLEKFLV